MNRLKCLAICALAASVAGCGGVRVIAQAAKLAPKAGRAATVVAKPVAPRTANAFAAENASLRAAANSRKASGGNLREAADLGMNGVDLGSNIIDSKDDQAPSRSAESRWLRAQPLK